MIRQIAGATGQSAQTMRAMTRRICNATPSVVADDRSDDLDNSAQLFVEDHQTEQEKTTTRET